MNMQSIMAQAKKMQNDMMKKKDEIDKEEFIGKAQNVEIVMYGNKHIKKINLDFDSISADDKEMVEDLLKIAFEDAIKKIEDKTEEVMGANFGSLNGLF